MSLSKDNKLFTENDFVCSFKFCSVNCLFFRSSSFILAIGSMFGFNALETLLPDVITRLRFSQHY